jgi:hypothetical protein
MYNVKIKYASGKSDIRRCTEDEARKAVIAAYGRMKQDGITDIIAWKDF